MIFDCHLVVNGTVPVTSTRTVPLFGGQNALGFEADDEQPG